MVAREGEHKASPQPMIDPSLARAGKYFIRQRIDTWGGGVPSIRRQNSCLALGEVQLLILSIAMVVSALPTYGQVAGGTIQGTVADTSGKVVTEARVSIKNLATGVITAVEDNDQGLYTAPNLVPGDYEVSCSAAGFAKTVVANVALNVGAQQRVDFTLKPGVVTESIVVHDLPPSIDLASSTLSNVVNQTTVRELPLNGRDWTQLATLETGVAAVHTQVALTAGPDRGNRGFGQQLTISGGRPAQNNYRLDGVSINDYSNGAPGSVLGSNLGVDAVEEFSVLTSNYSAEYGRTSGGVINAVTKSGTNAFHGTAYEFLRNSALDAKNFFDPAKKPPFKRNQFGASAGGPLIKDRTFIFGDYEGDRQSTGISTPISVPTNSAWNGFDFPDPVNPKVLAFRGLYPAVNDHCVTGCAATGIFTSVVNQVISENYFTIRGDHTLSSKGSLVGTYVFDNARQTQPDPLLVLLTGNSTKRQIATAEYTRTIRPTVINTVRFGFNRVNAVSGQNASALNPLAKDTTLGIFGSQPSQPQRPAPGVVINSGEIATLPGGLGASPNYQFHWNSFQLYDDAFITKGVHFLRFGFATEYIQDNILASSDANGVVRFGTLKDFLKNNPVEADFAAPGAIRERQIRQHLYAGYIQDDIRARPNLTLNAGLRYEMTTVPTENHGLISTLIKPAADDPTTDPKVPHTGNPFFLNPTYQNFEPRVGFAWDPLKNGRTAVRGGFGMFDVLPLPYLYELLVPLAAPFYQLRSGAPGSLSFPDQVAANITSLGTVRQSYVQHDPKRNYAMQWNLNIQREIAKDITGMVAYVGSRAVHQAFRADDINTANPFTPRLSRVAIFPGTDASGTPLGALMNPHVGQITTVTWGGDAHYNALQAKLTARAGSRFQAQASYTWGKGIDTGSATVGGDTFSNSISSLPIFNPALRRGLSDFNITHNLVISYNWMLPSGAQFAGPAKWLLSDWQLGGVAQVSTGVPFTPTVGVDALGLGSTDPWDFPDRKPGCNSLVNPGSVTAYINVNCLAEPSLPASSPLASLCLPSPAIPSSIPGEIQCSNKRGNLGRNSLIGPPLRNFDFSLFKNIPVKSISEAFRVQFRIEMFNIFNHPNFAPPLDHLSVVNPSGSDARVLAIVTGQGPGAIDSTVTSSRQIQFGLKVIW